MGGGRRRWRSVRREEEEEWEKGEERSGVDGVYAYCDKFFH